MPPTGNYALLSFLLSAVGYLGLTLSHLSRPQSALKLSSGGQPCTLRCLVWTAFLPSPGFCLQQCQLVFASSPASGCTKLSLRRLSLSIKLELLSMVTNRTLMTRLAPTLPPSSPSHPGCSLLWPCTLVGPCGRWMFATRF